MKVSLSLKQNRGGTIQGVLDLVPKRWCFQQLPWPQGSSSVLLWLLMSQLLAGLHVRCCTQQQQVVTALQRRSCRRSWPGIDYYRKMSLGRGVWQFGCCQRLSPRGGSRPLVRAALEKEEPLHCGGGWVTQQPTAKSWSANATAPGTCHQLEPPSAFCSSDYCADRNFLKMTIYQETFCVWNVNIKSKGHFYRGTPNHLVPMLVNHCNFGLTAIYSKLLICFLRQLNKLFQ